MSAAGTIIIVVVGLILAAVFEYDLAKARKRSKESTQHKEAHDEF